MLLQRIRPTPTQVWHCKLYKLAACTHCQQPLASRQLFRAAGQRQLAPMGSCKICGRQLCLQSVPVMKVYVCAKYLRHQLRQDWLREPQRQCVQCIFACLAGLHSMAWPGKSGASSKHGSWQSSGNSITQRLVEAISYTVMLCLYLILIIRSFLGIQRPCKHLQMPWHIRLFLRKAAPNTSSAVTSPHKTPKLLSLQRQTGHPHSAREISGSSILLHSSMDIL